jgi:tetratricopeptide (TPR) repeat protein
MAESKDDLTGQAKRYIAERRYDEAARVARRALLVSPDDVPLRVLLGEALLAQEKYDETRVEMLALTRRHPESASAHRILGEAYLRVGQMEKARTALEQARVRGDAAAQDLLQEAEGEAFVASSTIERWFGADEPKTVETELPPVHEEDTPVPGKGPALPLVASEPKIQIDPQFAREASIAIGESEDPAGETIPTVDHTQPNPRLPGMMGPQAEGLGSLLSKAKPAEVPKPAFVPPPAASKPLAAKPAPGRDQETSVARPQASKWAPAPAPSNAAAPAPVKVGTPAPGMSAPHRATLQGTPAPLDVAKVSAAASAFGAPSRRKQTLMGGISPVASVPKPATVPPPKAPPPKSVAPPPKAPPPKSVAPPPPDDDLARTNELDLRAHAGPPSGEEENDLTRPMSSSFDDAALTSARAPVHAAPMHAPPHAHAPPPAPFPPAHAPARARPPSAPPPARHKPTLMGVPSPAMPPLPPLDAPEELPELESLPPSKPPAAPRAMPPAPHGGHHAPPPPPAHRVGPHVALGPHGSPPAPPVGRPVPPGQTGAVTRRMDELATDPAQRSAGKSRDEVTASRRRGDPRRLARIAGASLMVLAVLLVIGGIVHTRMQAAAIAEDVEHASDEGARARYADLLERLEGESDPAIVALRARLLAERAVELGIGDWTAADAELATLDTSGGAVLDALVARALIAVARGQADQAATLLSGVQGQGVTLAEALHVQSIALLELGQAAQAREAASAASTLRPRAPRHAAMLARVQLALGDAAGAAQTLSIPAGEGSPLVHVVRGRVALAQGDAAAADAEASAVLTTLLDAAAPHDVAEAHLVRARAALARGDRDAARAALDEASNARAPFDEPLALEIADAFLAAAAPDRARSVLATLGATTSNGDRRARVVVAASIAAGDLAGADAALVSLGASPQADLLRARVRDAQGRAEEARMLYEHAAAEPTVAREARLAEGELLLRTSRPADARAALEPALRAAPTDAVIVDAYVRAVLATGDLAAAEAALTPAIAASPSATALRVSHARVLLRRGRATEALTEMQAIASGAQGDTSVQSALADAALAAGNREVASAAYQAVLAAAESADAHLGLATVLAEDAHFEDALTHVARAEAMSPAVAVEVAHLRGRIEVMRGLGAAAVEAATQRTTASPRDALLWAYLAALEVQAEEFGDADTSCSRALRLDADQPEALLVRALLDVEDGDLGGAARAVDRAERSATSRGLPPSFAARIAAVRGRLRFEAGDEAGAQRLAQQAVTLDARSGAAHLLLADVAVSAHGDPVPELTLAVEGTGAPPEAVGRLAMRLERGPTACGFARAYVERAPGGYDRDAVDEVLRRCR